LGAAAFVREGLFAALSFEGAVRGLPGFAAAFFAAALFRGGLPVAVVPAPPSPAFVPAACLPSRRPEVETVSRMSFTRVRR
jgi:hypothetical protein